VIAGRKSKGGERPDLVAAQRDAALTERVRVAKPSAAATIS
jgi:hypothetical protein